MRFYRNNSHNPKVNPNKNISHNVPSPGLSLWLRIARTSRITAEIPAIASRKMVTTDNNDWLDTGLALFLGHHSMAPGFAHL